MTNKESFKIGFLTKLAELGLTPADMEFALSKIAEDIPSVSGAGKAVGLFGALNTIPGISSGLRTGKEIAMLLALPSFVGGNLVGLGARHLMSADEQTVEDIKTKEKIDLYRRLSAEAKERVRAKRLDSRRNVI